VQRLLGVLSLVLAVYAGLTAIRSPSIRIRSPFELGAVELVVTIAGFAGLILSGWLILQIGWELMDFGSR